ncbi:MAG: NAD(P)/FAD-dependent oxidoreductase [Clostridia bacterium]
MKVAILGAGLSGLSCAKYLEDNNIEPFIFEKRERVGERFPNMEAVMQLVHRPIKDPVIYLNKKYNMNLMPAGLVHTLEIYSPNHKAVFTGYNLGYTTIRGHDDRSWERQLARQVRAKIHFNSTVTWQELEKDFDRIVIATGDPTISRELKVWRTDTEAFLKGCIVKGKFDMGVSKIWLKTKMSKNCMVYFAPFDEKEASYCTVAIPSSQEELDVLWSRTIEELKFEPVPQTEFKFEEYKMGRVSTRQIGKKLLAGAAGGFVLPFLGFGQIPSILSGIQAAESIITGKDYNKLTSWFDKRYENSLILRNYVNNMDNEGFDRLVSFLNLPMVSNLLANTNLPVIGMSAKAVSSRNFIKRPKAQRS